MVVLNLVTTNAEAVMPWLEPVLDVLKEIEIQKMIVYAKKNSMKMKVKDADNVQPPVKLVLVQMLVNV